MRQRQEVQALPWAVEVRLLWVGGKAGRCVPAFFISGARACGRVPVWWMSTVGALLRGLGDVLWPPRAQVARFRRSRNCLAASQPSGRSPDSRGGQSPGLTAGVPLEQWLTCTPAGRLLAGGLRQRPGRPQDAARRGGYGCCCQPFSKFQLFIPKVMFGSKSRPGSHGSSAVHLSDGWAGDFLRRSAWRARSSACTGNHVGPHGPLPDALFEPARRRVDSREASEPPLKRDVCDPSSGRITPRVWRAPG